MQRVAVGLKSAKNRPLKITKKYLYALCLLESFENFGESDSSKLKLCKLLQVILQWKGSMEVLE